MFFLFGVRTKTTPIRQIQLLEVLAADYVHGDGIETWFTLFFIPVIPLGGSHLIRCNLCGLTLKCSPELKAQIESKAMAAGA